MTDPTASPPPRSDVAAARSGDVPRPRSRSFRWLAFFGLAVVVVAVDQAAKAAVTSALAPGQSVRIIDDLLRIVFGQNTGALFGLFKDNAVMFGIVSIVVVGLIVAYHAKAPVSPYLTVTLGLLLGGAIGNMVDRLRLGYVVDFVDAGIGTTRFYTFNVADSAISLSVLLLLLAALRPSLVDRGPTAAAPTVPDEAEADRAFWGDDDSVDRRRA